jgi:transposase InsO family protein
LIRGRTSGVVELAASLHLEVLVSHRNARLTLHGRRELVRRVRQDNRPVSHVAKEMGLSRQCAHKWLRRFDLHGEAGLQDRSSRPRTCPTRTPAQVEQRVLQARREYRCDAVALAAHTGVPASTCGRIMRRHRVPWLADCDPITGAVIRARRVSARRYEHPHPGDLVHVDVKKVGRIPDGGGWRVHGRSEQVRGRGIGYDYVHAAVDDHSRLAYAEILADEKGVTTAGFLARAVAWFAAHGITIATILTDNAMNYRHSHAVADILTEHRITHRFIRPHCPWTNGKVERFNRTLAKEWAYRRAYRSNTHRTRALPQWLATYNNQRPHTALGGQPPITRLSPTS